MKGWIIGAALVFLLSGHAVVAKEPDGFMGVTWGASCMEAKEIILARLEKKRGPIPMGFGVREECPSKSLSFYDTIGESRVRVFFTFVDDRFVDAWLNFKSIEYRALLGAFSAVYGQPHTSRDSVVTNRMGAEFDSHVAAWQLGAVTIDARQRAGRIDEGRISISTEEYITHLRIEARKAREQGAQDLR